MLWSRCFAFLFLLAVVGLVGLNPLTAADEEAPAAEQPAGEAPAGEAPAAEQEITPAQAKELIKEQLKLTPTMGPATFDLGGMAQINLPADYQGLNGNDTRKLLQFYGNLVGSDEVGTIEPLNEDWFVVFEFDPVGYVKDEDKNELDAAEMLETMQAGQEAANAQRKEMGLDELELTGWAMEPNYNPQTHNLQWAIKIRNKTSGGESVNHFTRLLGRRGVMEVALVCGPDQLQSTLPTYEQLLQGYTFKQGEDYASFTSGDKVAEYGLAALVTGGAAAVAFKTGLLAKLGIFLAKAWKIVAVAAVAVFAAIGRLLGLGKKSA